MEAVKSPGDIIFDNFGAGGIKSHSKTPLIQLCTFPKRGMSKIPGADSAGGFFPNAPGRRGFGWGGVGWGGVGGRNVQNQARTTK